MVRPCSISVRSFEKQEDRLRGVFLGHHHEIVDERLDHREGVFPDLLGRDPISDGLSRGESP